LCRDPHDNAVPGLDGPKRRPERDVEQHRSAR
jgi:hypothetical protein